MVTERTATSITLTWDSGNPEPVSYYIIQHKSKYSDDLYKEIDGVATTRYSVGGLSPYSDYEFRVVAVNNIGRGPPSEIIEAKTAEQAPSTAPRQVRGHMMSSTTAVIHWDEPEEANGQIMGYRVYYTMDSGQHVNLWEKQIVRGSNFVTIQGLIPNKTYYIKVLAYTSVGDGPLSPDLQIITKTGGRPVLSHRTNLDHVPAPHLVHPPLCSSLPAHRLQGRSQIGDEYLTFVDRSGADGTGEPNHWIRACLQEERRHGGGDPSGHSL